MKRIDFQKHIVMCAITFVLALCSFSGLRAQSEPNASDFKGQALGKTVNTEYDEMVPRLSPNGQRMYFSRLQHPSNVGGRNSGQDIWYSDRKPDGTWLPAQNAGASINNKHHNSVGGIATGEKILFLANTYDTDPLEVRPGISFTKMGASTWEMPQTIFGPSVISDMGKSLDFYVTPDQKYMLISMAEKGKVKPDIFVSTRIEEGLYSLPKSLGDIINFPNSAETTPSLSQDTKMLFFSSDVEGGMGSGDIYFSERLDDTWINWSEPQNMGPEVNTAGYDGHFVMGYDGMYAYFVSGKTPTANGDIYEVELRHLSIFKDDLPDTLHVLATAGKTLSLEMDQFGINAQNIRLIAHNRIDGRGKVQLEEGATNFEYLAPTDYQGTDRFEFLICDPPQSDDCKRVVVVANVDNGAVPVVMAYRLKTKQNVATAMESTLPEWSQSRTVGAYESYPGPKGKIATTSAIGQGNFVYTPAKDFVGTDSIPVLGPCPDGFSNNCLKAVILIEVAPAEAVAVVAPIVEEPVIEVEPIIEEPIVVVEPIIEEPIVVVEPIIEEPVVVVEPIIEEPIVVVPVIEEPVLQSVPTELQITGHVFDDPSGFPMETEILFFEGEKEVGRTKSDAVTGAFAITLPNGRDYAFATEQPFYFPVSGEIEKGKAAIKGQVNQDIRLTPIPLEAGQTFVLKHIYFDTDQSILKPDSKAELIRLQDLMRRNPNMEIEVRGHTDSQSDDAHNQALSESRAAAVINYLKYQGVMGYRLSSKGYGETKPIATNETEEGRSLNRRVEFFIKKM